MTFSRIFKKLHRVFDLCPLGQDTKFRVHFYEKAGIIPQAWQDLLTSQPGIFLQPAYLQALEDSRPLDMQFIYACVEKDRKPVAFLYFQVIRVRLDQADDFLNPLYFSKELDEISKGSNNVFLKSYFSKPLHILFCGNAFLSGEYFCCIHPKADHTEVMNALPPLIEEVRDRVGEQEKLAAVVVKDFYTEKQDRHPAFEKAGFRSFEFEPNMMLEMRKNWHSFDDYLNDLSSKYRVRARNVLKRAELILVKEYDSDEIREQADLINSLYNQVHKKAAVHFSAVDASYFAGLKTRLKERFLFRAFLLDGKLIAFSTLLCQEGECEAHLVGLDYTYNKSHAMYAFILYQYIRDSIQRKAKFLSFGRTASEIKSTVGAKPWRMYCYMKLQSPLSDKLISSFASANSTEDHIMRDPFRETALEKVKSE